MSQVGLLRQLVTELRQEKPYETNELVLELESIFGKKFDKKHIAVVRCRVEKQLFPLKSKTSNGGRPISKKRKIIKYHLIQNIEISNKHLQAIILKQTKELCKLSTIRNIRCRVLKEIERKCS